LLRERNKREYEMKKHVRERKWRKVEVKQNEEREKDRTVALPCTGNQQSMR
jgi:hypothetical protein